MDASLFAGIGSAIRSLRESRGLNRDRLATRIGVHPSTLSHLESGRNYPSWNSLSKILDALDADLLGLHYALTGEPAPPPPPVNAVGPDEPIDYFKVRMATEWLAKGERWEDLKEIAMSGKLPGLERAGETSGLVDKGTAPVRGKADRGNGS